MIVQTVVFYLLSALLIAAGVMVISARNPVHSVLYLILAFFQAAGLFVLLGAEFVAMIVIIVYVGAVAVLFLFVVMMLDINFAELRQGFVRYLPLGALVGTVLLGELVMVLNAWAPAPGAAGLLAAPTPAAGEITNTHALGNILYTNYAYLFQVSGLILLIAMVGAIVLTLRRRPGVLRQSISKQLARTKDEVLVVRNVPTRGGI